MDRAMLPDSLGDDHPKITINNQLDIYDNITLCISKIIDDRNQSKKRRN